MCGEVGKERCKALTDEAAEDLTCAALDDKGWRACGRIVPKCEPEDLDEAQHAHVLVIPAVEEQHAQRRVAPDVWTYNAMLGVLAARVSSSLSMVRNLDELRSTLRDVSESNFQRLLRGEVGWENCA